MSNQNLSLSLSLFKRKTWRENRMTKQKVERENFESIMELKNTEDDVRLLVDRELDSSSSSSSSSFSSMVICRICHEEEDESSTSMESPCACSGTLKFAHRDCIQRWCDEKGNTCCEICLQEFEPGYSVPPKLALLDIAVTIRGSLEVPRPNYDSQNTGFSDDESDREYPQCSSPSDRSANFFRSLALTFMLLLLARHVIVIVTAGEDYYPFALATVLLLRASGIILPFYFILRMIAAIQKGQRQNLRRLQLDRRVPPQMNGVEEAPQLTIQIQS